MTWHWIAAAYLVSLIGAALARREFCSVRKPILLGGATIGTVTALDGLLAPFGAAGAVIVPSLVLLAGYRLSGLFFNRVDRAAESRLLAIDQRLLGRRGILAWHGRLPAVVTEFLELSYFLVYPALPIGAAILLRSASPAVIDQYWNAVLSSSFICYGMLPWLQVRPPMLVEPAVARARGGPMRRVNQLIAAGASVRACTVPSGHVAAAFAAAVSVGSVIPAAGAGFLVLAITLSIASVLGRYHYAVDACLGFIIGVTAGLVF